MSFHFAGGEFSLICREIEIQHRKNKRKKENERAIEIWEKMLGCKSFFPLANAKHKKGRGGQISGGF